MCWTCAHCRRCLETVGVEGRMLEEKIQLVLVMLDQCCVGVVSLVDNVLGWLMLNFGSLDRRLDKQTRYQTVVVK
jgi:hypothetical protein